MDDFAASTSTTALISQGSGYVRGDIETAGDQDWIRVELTAGGAYRILVSGAQPNTGPASGTLYDPALQIRDANGALIPSSTNGLGLNEMVDFTAPASGSYYLAVSSAQAGSTGTWMASVRPYVSNIEFANYLTTGFWQSGQLGATGTRHFDHSSLTVNISALGDVERSFALAALGQFQEVSKLTFTVVDGAADITFRNSGSKIAEGGSTLVNGVSQSATITISADWITGPGFDTQAFKVYMHETAHGLGIGHPGPYNGGQSEYGVTNIFANDSTQYTVMGYLGWPGQQLQDRVVTLQMGDIQAIQDLYGVNTSTRSGDTVYGFGSTAGSRYDFANYPSGVTFTIYDTGGVDTLDASGYSQSQILDLRPGHFSSVGGFVDNIGVFTSSRIEVAVGGGGSDRLIAGDQGGQLYGRAGSDTLSATSGVTYLRGEEGSDSLSGGGDFDDINGNQGADTAHGNGGGDWVVGGKDNDLLYGDADGDIVYGNLGDDTAHGGDGDDWVRGGQGDDVVEGGVGADWIAGDRGSDTLSGGGGADTFHVFSGSGLDRVLDFNRGEGDRVQVAAGTGYGVSQSGADVVILMNTGDQMVLVGVNLSSLTGDWLFVV